MFPLEQGARTVCSGSYYTMPKLAVNGGVFVGDSASMQNIPALKGIHVSMKSGMLAAEAVLQAFNKSDFTQDTLNSYQLLFEKSWLKTEMFEGRNFSQALAIRGLKKLIHLGAQYITKGRGIFDRMPLEADSKTLKPVTAGAESSRSNPGQKALDNELYVDKLTAV